MLSRSRQNANGKEIKLSLRMRKRWSGGSVLCVLLLPRTYPIFKYEYARVPTIHNLAQLCSTLSLCVSASRSFSHLFCWRSFHISVRQTAFNIPFRIWCFRLFGSLWCVRCTITRTHTHISNAQENRYTNILIIYTPILRFRSNQDELSLSLLRNAFGFYGDRELHISVLCVSNIFYGLNESMHTNMSVGFQVAHSQWFVQTNSVSYLLQLRCHLEL